MAVLLRLTCAPWSALMCAAHVAVMASCLGLTTLLMSGAGGPQFSKQEVEDLLAQGRRARHLCKRWIPSQVSASYKQTLRQQEEYLAETLSLQPGRDLLDVDDEEFVPMTITSAPRCWGCGRHSSTLRKCSACQEAAYCRCAPLLLLQLLHGAGLVCVLLVVSASACRWLHGMCLGARHCLAA